MRIYRYVRIIASCGKMHECIKLNKEKSLRAAWSISENPFEVLQNFVFGIFTFECILKNHTCVYNNLFETCYKSILNINFLFNIMKVFHKYLKIISHLLSFQQLHIQMVYS